MRPRELPIIIDTREQRPLTFPPVASGKWKWNVTTTTRALQTGDYSLIGHSGAKGEPAGISIERKASLDEIANNLTDGRERFLREMQRLSLFETKVLVIEGSPTGAMRSKIDRRAFRASIDAISEKFSVNVRWCPQGRAEVTEYVLDCLRRYAERLRKHEKD